MANAAKSKRFDLPADTIWAKIGAFDGVQAWHPAVAGTKMSDDGNVRTLTLGDGATIIERLVGQGDQSYTYVIMESPLPVADYESTLRVRADGGGSVVEWEGKFSPAGVSEADAVAIVEGIYQAGLDAL